MDNPIVLTIAEACAAARIGRTSLYQEIKAGRLRAIKQGRRTKILPPPISRAGWSQAPALLQEATRALTPSNTSVIVHRQEPIQQDLHRRIRNSAALFATPANSCSQQDHAPSMNTGDCFEYSLAALATGRDAPLTFAWRTSQSAMAALELHSAHNSRYEDARSAVLSEAVLADSHGRAVSYSRRKAHYVGRRRYYGPSYAYRTVLAAVSDGVAAGLLKEQRARPGSRDRQSCFRATSRLARLLKTSRPEYRPGLEVIWLRDGNGSLIDYHDCPLTDRLRQEVETINRQLESIAVAFSGPDVCSEGNWWVVGGTQYLSAPPRLRRVFSRGSFDLGGRAYGAWQSLPARHRALMLINGEATLEPDFVALHPSIIYASHGIRLVGDPYETADFARDYGKTAFNVAVNAKSYPSARAAIAHDLELDMASATRLLRAITSKHRAVSDQFFSDTGVRLMRIDSDIALNTVVTCQIKGIPVLPVHDSFITPASQAGQTAEIMEACFVSRFPQSGTCRVRIKSPPKSHVEKRGAA